MIRRFIITMASLLVILALYAEAEDHDRRILERKEAIHE